MLIYKGYVGHVTYDDEAKLFHGEVIGIRAVITFQGTNVDEIETSFRDSIDDYLDWCVERGKPPEKPFSGRFNLRISPELHAQLTQAAQAHSVSLNKYVQDALALYIQQHEKRFIA